LQFTATHITIMVVAALLAIVPSTAVAVTTTFTSIVDAKTGVYAQVSNSGQLEVRGPVSNSDVVPTSSWSSLVRIEDQGHPIQAIRLLQSAPAGQGLTVGEVSVRGIHPDHPVIALETRYVANGSACISNIVGGPYLWIGGTPSPSDQAVTYSFPIPLTVEPDAGRRACLYVNVGGFNDFADVSVVGAQGPNR
jgi:hypothetical protein